MPRPSRTQKPKRSIKDLPDFAILNDAETCEVLNISPDTRRRLRDSGELPHVQVSDGRIGVSVGTIRAYVARRTENASA
jgi:predicted site-specific integrase-resolvase